MAPADFPSKSLTVDSDRAVPRDAPDTASLVAAYRYSMDGVFLTAPDGRIFSANPAACQMLGRSEEEICRIGRAGIIDGSDPRLAGMLQERASKGAVRGELTFIRPDGSGFPVEFTSAIYHDPEGNPRTVTIVRDITETKRAQEAIRQLNLELERRVEERTSDLQLALGETEAITHTVSHDLRSPLRAMNGYARILIEECSALLSDEHLDCLRRIGINAGHMGQMIDDMLSYYRYRQAPMRRMTVDVASLARAELAVQLSADGKVKTEVEDVPPCEADYAMLREVLARLISNALKYSRSVESPLITIGFANGAYFVRDNGIGFDMTYANKLYGVFNRLNRIEDFEGTGIGLAIVKRIIERHQGRVWAQSAVGRGATFFFTLAREPSISPGT